MKIGRWAWMLLAAAPLLSGCAGFWDTPPSSGSFTLSNSGNISVTPGATTGNTSTITVTPASSFTGTVSLACSVTSAPSGATSPATCSLSPTSLAFSTATALTSTLSAATTSTTTAGSYQITVTGTSGSASQTTSLCAQVSSTGATCTASSGSNSGIFYIVNSNSITGYSISSGALTAISGSSFTLTVATISSVAIAPSGNFLYLATNAGIVPFTINSSTGALTQGSAFGDNLAEAIAVDPSGKWLLEASVAGILYAYPITSSGAQDSTRSVQTTANLASNLVQPGGIAISPNGALVAVALGTSGTQVFAFNASPTSGGPLQAGATPISPTHSGGAAVAVAFDPQSRLMYVGETNAFPNSTTNNSGGLRSFVISGSSWSELSSSASPIASGGTTPRAILPISTGKDVYVANWVGSSTGNVTGFSVASANSTYALLALSPTVATGTEPYGLAEDSTLGYVLAVSNSGTTFDAYTLTSGLLTSSVTGSPVSSPIAIVALP